MADYAVSVNGGDEIMIRAKNQAGARNYAVREAVKVRVMKPDDYMALGRAGKDLIDVTDEPEAVEEKTAEAA